MRTMHCTALSDRDGLVACTSFGQHQRGTSPPVAHAFSQQQSPTSNQHQTGTRRLHRARSHRKHGEQGAVQACRLPNRGPYMNVIRLPRYDGRIATVASIMTPKFKIKTDGKLLPSLLLHNHHHHHRWRECAANRATKRRDPARAR